MPYVQIWLAVDPAHEGLLAPDLPDDPIKHPCKPPLSGDPELSRALGAENVQNSTPVFFVDDASIWTLVSDRAKQESRTVAEVIAEAVHAYVTPPAHQ
jgi:hypothetical protein